MDTESALQAFIDDLDEDEMKRLLFHLLAKRNSDGLNGRRWDTTEHLRHETAVARAIGRVNSE